MGALLLVGVLLRANRSGGADCWRDSVKQSRKSAQGVKAMGTVVNLVSRVFNPGSAGVYCPVVDFTTAAGQPVRFESQFGTMPANYLVGQSIAVRYRPTRL